MNRLEILAKRFAAITYPILTTRYASGCCIAAARIGIEVFEYFGYQAVEIPCTVWVPNRDLVKRLVDSDGEWPDDAQSRQWMADGCYSVVVGHPNHQIANGISAHLILRVESFFIDPTIPQAHRPHRGIDIPAGVVFRSADLASGRDDIIRSDQAQMLHYHPRESKEYLTSPDWATRRWKRLAGVIIRELRCPTK